jgi:hypothetical protein
LCKLDASRDGRSSFALGTIPDGIDVLSVETVRGFPERRAGVIFSALLGAIEGSEAVEKPNLQRLMENVQMQGFRNPEE